MLVVRGVGYDDPIDSHRDPLERTVRRMQRGVGVEEGFRQLHARYQRRFRRQFRSWGADPAQLDDLVQELFLRVYRNLAGFAHRAPFEAWLTCIARNVWYEHGRFASAKKRHGIEVSLGAHGDAVRREIGRLVERSAVRAEDALARVLRQERHAWLVDAVDRLPPRMRECVLLALQDRATYAEIAALQRISVSTVKAHIRQARERLRCFRARAEGQRTEGGTPR